MRLAKNRMNVSRSFGLLLAIGGLAVGLPACSDSSDVKSSSSESGTLVFTANGEEFVREGLLSRDQWQVNFDHVYVTFDQISATPDPLTDDTEERTTVDGQESVQWDGPKTVDLVVDENPLILSQVSAPAGQYRALNWKMSPAESGPAQGSSILITGSATKEAQALAFTLRLNPTLEFRCGAYVGDERKGIVPAQGSAELESTFHFDHFFGNGEAPADDEINRGSLGIDPLAKLAQAGTLDTDLTELSTQLSPEDSAKLEKILLSLGHVGEGHCEATADA